MGSYKLNLVVYGIPFIKKFFITNEELTFILENLNVVLILLSVVIVVLVILSLKIVLKKFKSIEL